MKTARRLFSLALVLVMVLSLSVTAFATSMLRLLLSM